jgi:hypothetical protein
VEEHNFTPAERAFFGSQLDQINRMFAAMNNAANLVMAQNGLEGEWQLKPDGSGLVRVSADVSNTPEDLRNGSA